MPYVLRDASGQVCALFQKPDMGADEFLATEHPDIQVFLRGIVPQNEKNSATAELYESDISLIRVIEDIVDTLIDKNVIMFTDLPVEAQEKILLRKSTRRKMSSTADILEDEDKIF